MNNRLCSLCVNSCKQDESVKIVRCPRFQKKISQEEFVDLIDDLKKMEIEAENIKSRTSNLMKILSETSSNKKLQEE